MKINFLKHSLCYLSVISLLGTASVGFAVNGTTTVLSGAVTFKGTYTVGLGMAIPELLRAKSKGKPKEMRQHLLPNGKTTASIQLEKSLLAKLPLLAPNVTVRNPKLSALIPGPSCAISSRSHSILGIVAMDDAPFTFGEIEPPDQGLAVNNNVIAEINNVVLRFFNANSGAALSEVIPLTAFFLDAGAFADPQIFFDPSTSRWFVTLISGDLPVNQQGFDVAVSRTPDPLGTYNVYRVRAKTDTLAGCGGVDCFPDYQKGGYDQNGFYISANLFNGNTFVNAATFAVSKSDLINNTVGNAIRFDYPATPSSFVVQPSVPAPGQPFIAGANGTEYLMEARNITDATNSITVWAIWNTNNINTTPGSLVLSGTNIPVEAYAPSVPATQPNVINPMCSGMGGTVAPSLDAGIWSFQSTVQLSGNNLYGALSFGTNDPSIGSRDALAWFVITPSITDLGVVSATVAKQGYVLPPAAYSLIYPAFGLNNVGKGALSFTITNPNSNLAGGFPSTAFVDVENGNLGSSIYVAGIGQSSDQGYTGCGNQPTVTVGRWGDYGAATIDSQTGHAYVANEYIPEPANWGTQTNWGTCITQIH